MEVFKNLFFLLFLLFLPAVNSFADSVPVVTIGADLSEEQKDIIFSFFDVDKESVQVIEVSNDQEHEYLDDIASNDIIGTHTYSCAYIKPTDSGGIQVKTTNLTWVTDNMIKSTLLTAGVSNCEVMAAAPFEVSGTGALTGAIIAYQKATNEELDRDKVDLANEELFITGEISEDNDSDDVVNYIAEAKEKVLESDVKSKEDIEKILDDINETYNLDITKENYDKLRDILYSISKEDYDVESVKESLGSIYNSVVEKINDPETKENANSFLGKMKEFIVNFIDNDNNDDSSESFLDKLKNWLYGHLG